MLTKRSVAEDHLSWHAHAQSEAIFGKLAAPAPLVLYQAPGISASIFFGFGLIVGHEIGLVREIGGGNGAMPGASSAVTALVKNENYMAAGTAGGEVLVGSWTTGGVTMLGGENGAHGGQVNDLHCVGFCLAVASEDATCSVWDAHTGESIATLEGHAEGITAVRCLKANAAVVDTIATGSRDTTIKLWDLATAACLLTMEKHGETISSFDLVGDRLFSGGLDGIKVWSAAKGKCLHQIDMAGEVSHFKVVGNVVIAARNGLALNAATEIVVLDWEKTRVLSQLYLGPLACVAIDATPTRISAALKDPSNGVSTVLCWDYGMNAITGGRKHTAER